MYSGSSPCLLRAGDDMARAKIQITHGSLDEMQQRSLAYVTKLEHVHGTFTFPRHQGSLRLKMPRAIMCPAEWGHLTRCSQLDDGTRQLAEVTYKDALQKHGCLDTEDLQYEAEFLTWDQASQNTFVFACHLTSTLGIRVSWNPFHPDWIASATNICIAQVMINTQYLVHTVVQHKDKWRRAQTMEVLAEGKQVTMRFVGGETFMMKTEGQDTTTGYPTLREAIQQTFPTLVRISQHTEPGHIFGKDCQENGRKKIGWAQAVYPLRARLQ